MIYRESAVGIPPVKPSDAEDVVWGLETAGTLWSRGERIDALVWLRRAAQAAGDANDDDRAFELAKLAAELTEWMARQSFDAEQSIEVDTSEEEPTETGRAASTAAPPGASQTATTVAPDADYSEESEPTAVRRSYADQQRDDAESVLPAEQVHAGMFDPWSDSKRVLPAAGAPPPQLREDDDDEVVTSVRPHALAAREKEASSMIPAAAVAAPALPIVSNVPRPVAPKRPPPPLPKPPPLPPRAQAPLPKAAPPPILTEEPAPISLEPMSLEPISIAPDPSIPPEPSIIEVGSEVLSAPPVSIHEMGSEVQSVPPSVEAEVPAPAAPPPAELLDLESVEAFADLPDDARIAFAAAATISHLADGEEIGNFALAYVLEGTFDVAATMVDAPAVRLSDGAVLRSRGTTEENVPMRMICSGKAGRIATWSDDAVEEAFRSIPWVEEDLRAAADRVQTLVGITIGPLGERLDVSIREQIVGRLTMRPLAPAEIVVNEGEAVPGLLLVGIGELELVKDGKVTGNVGSGDFLFPTEVLGAGSAPTTARAGPGGALVLFGDRGIAQELLVTCPPLLEVFAGM